MKEIEALRKKGDIATINAKYGKFLQDMTNSTSQNSVLPDAYCAPATSSVTFEFVTNVTYAGINNTTAGVAGLNDYTAQQATVTQGDATSISVSIDPDANDYVWAMIDWNQNEVWDLATEAYLVASATSSSGPHTLGINVPGTATTGVTRMRVAVVWGATAPTWSGCTSYTFGEIEDYSVNVLPNLNCAGTPDPGNTVSSVPQVCSGTSFNLSLQNAQGAGTTYQWQSGPSSTGPWTNFGANAANISTSQTTATWYQCVVTCTFSTLSATSAPVQVTMNSYLNCYCAAGATSTLFEKISRVQFGTIDNTSFSSAGYEDFTALSTNALQGTYIPITVTLNDDPYPTDQVLVWIDYNLDGDFNDAGELAYTSALGVGPHSGVIHIPVTATPGTAKMRVRLHDSSLGANSTPCGNSTYGQVEDYLVELVANPPCSGTPAPGNTLASSPTICYGNTVDLSLENTTAGNNVTYQWQENTGSGFVNVPGAIYPFYTATVLGVTSYQCIVTCTGNSTTSSPVTITLNPFIECYCTPPVEDCSLGDNITRVAISTLDNSSACSPNGFGDYKTTLPPTTIYSGTLNPIHIEGVAYSASLGNLDGYAVWIDFNRNGIYEASEVTRIGNNVAGFDVLSNPDAIFDRFIDIPSSVTPGLTGMRVRSSYGFYPDGFSPCEEITGYGETEEYIVDIQPCVPAVITSSPSNTSAVCGDAATFSASASGTYPAYQWQMRGDPNALHTMTFTNNTALAVPDADPAGVYSTIAVAGIPAGAIITDVSIKVNIDHTYVGDMENNIIAPNGVSLNLIGELDNGSGSNSSDNFTNTIISSTGTVPLSGAAAPRTGTFRADRLSGYGPSAHYQTSANGMPWSDLYTVLNGN
ncbi:MAG: proprotein convertase P-domain-containing protein, partial [Chitinophagales bacterium]|nr:proprotein convertase P-domain-containing protein [Chitinophagales bacterium]